MPPGGGGVVFTVTQLTPEPSTALLFALGLAGLGLGRRRAA
ncbi:MAG: PEP-CTERM sorting domain-containing protein [Planctomycetota bacterium]